jgi:hypothetical protein
LQEKFRSLIFALGFNNPNLRMLLITGKVSVYDLVHMEEKELATDELKKKNAEIKAYEMQARRTDAVLEQNLKQNLESAMYQCGGCKSRKVTMHAM